MTPGHEDHSPALWSLLRKCSMARSLTVRGRFASVCVTPGATKGRNPFLLFDVLREFGLRLGPTRRYHPKSSESSCRTIPPIPHPTLPRTSPDTRRTLAVAPLIADKRCYGECPASVRRGSGEAPWYPHLVWLTQLKLLRCVQIQDTLPTRPEMPSLRRTFRCQAGEK